MFILKANAGLCNKLLSMAAGLHLAQDAGVRLHVLWATDMHMHDLFTDLFEPVSAFSLHQLRIPSSRICQGLARRILPRAFGERNDIEAILDHEERFVEAFKVNPNRLWRFSSFREFYPADDFSWLKPRPEIAAHIAESRSLTEGEVVGMHIRRGDHVQAMRCSPLPLFYQRVAEEVAANSSVRFFLSTDDPEVKRDLKTKYPRNIFTRECVKMRHESGGGADAVVDLWLLSQCKKIYGTFPSSFSLVASKIGKTAFEWVRDPTQMA